MKQPWPIETRLRKQLLAAVLATVVAALDGIVMVLAFSPLMVLIEILLASLAIIQWCLYFNLRTEKDFGSWLAEHHKDK